MNEIGSQYTIGNSSYVSWKDEKRIVVSHIVEALNTTIGLQQKQTTALSQHYSFVAKILETYMRQEMSFDQCLLALQPLSYLSGQEGINIYISIINTLNHGVASHERIFSIISKKMLQTLIADTSYEVLLLDALE